MDPQRIDAKVRRRSILLGSGCLVQGVGLLVGGALIIAVPVVGWVLGPIVILGLLLVGSNMATVYECGNCRNPVASRRVKLCPTCGAHLS